MPRRYVFSVPVGPGHHERLGRTLASLSAQAADVRVALCHAGDEHDIAEVIAPFRPMISYERHGQDAGQSAAINEGWRAVEGDVYGWLNADDALAPDALEKVDSLLDREGGAHIVCGQSLIHDESDHFTGLHPAVKAPDQDLFRSNIVSQPSCFMRREALFETGLLREDLHYVMDWDLWVRLMAAGRRFAYTDDVLSSVLWGRNTKTASISPARMREIRSVVARQHSPLTTAKTLFGFTVHHLSEYSALSAPMQALRSVLRSGRPRALTYWGKPSGENVMVRLFHYRDAPTSGLRIYFTGRGERRISVGETAIETDEVAANLDYGLPPGIVRAVRISGPGFHPSDIRKIAPTE